MANATYDLEWAWIDFKSSDTWSVVLKKLKREQVRESELARSVYVIRIKSRIGIAYPNGMSPVLYVGEGRLKQRVDSHRKWLTQMEKTFGELALQLTVATPRVRNNAVAYKETEAALIQFFIEKYGSAPLKNSHVEYQKFDHAFTKVSLAEALTPGNGAKYYWAVQPTTINAFHSVFVQTHRDA